MLSYIFLTLLFGGSTAFMSGRSFALTWRKISMLIGAVLLLTLATRFIHFSILQTPLLNWQAFLIDFASLMFIALLGYRMTRKKQMLTQYWWLYEPAGMLGFSLRKTPLETKNNA